jgi:hypothetical protein
MGILAAACGNETRNERTAGQVTADRRDASGPLDPLFEDDLQESEEPGEPDVGAVDVLADCLCDIDIAGEDTEPPPSQG